MDNLKGEKYTGTGFLLLQDAVLSCAASLLSVLLVRWLSEPIPGFSLLVLVWVGLALAGTLVGTLASGSHRVVRRWATLSSSWRLVRTIITKESVLTLVLVTGLVKMPSTALSVVAVLTDGMLTTLFLFYIRFAARLFSRGEVSQVKALSARQNAVVAGTDAEAVSLAMELSKQYNVVGFLTEDERLNGHIIRDIMVYHVENRGQLERLEWRLGGIDCVFLPQKSEAPGEGAGQPGPASAPDVSPELSVPDGMSAVGRFLKRSFDVTASLVLMLLFLPLALLCALAVKLEDGGPALYKQERIGKGGKSFYILKFRSMRVDAEANGARLFGGDNDPRLTRTGAFLRAHHLDELPQLWNVFRGDMSFIGYRPERQVYIRQIMERNPRYRYLYQIRPGVTSYATLYNGYTDSLEKMLTRLDLDLYYLRNHSLLFDARVLGLTFLRIVSGKKF